jgi:hypothetical protein
MRSLGTAMNEKRVYEFRDHVEIIDTFSEFFPDDEDFDWTIEIVPPS